MPSNLPRHYQKDCTGFCPFHNPSNHHMRSWMMSVKDGLTQRICPHGLFHLDPDSVAWFKSENKEIGDLECRACDGCCKSRKN